VTDQQPDLGALLTRTLQERALDAPHPAGLADRARREARQVRRRRTLTAVAVLALAVTTILLPQVVPGQRTATPPAHQLPDVELVAPAGARTVVTLDDLPAGPAPGRAWLDGRSFHRADGRVVPVPWFVTVAVEYGAGAIAYRPAEHPMIYVLDPTGRVLSTESGSPPVAGRYGQVAYVDGGRGRLEVLWPDNPASSWSVPLPNADATTPIGFLQDSSVVVRVDRGRSRDPSTSIVTRAGSRPWRGAGEVTATYASGRALAVTRHDQGPTACLELWPTPRAAGGWRHCDAGGAPTDQLRVVSAFAPDSHLILVRGRDEGSRGSGRLVVADSAGEVVRELVQQPGAGELFGQAVFENGNKVLVAVWARGRSAIVRCDPAGRCETAGEPRVTAWQDWQPAPFGAST
jgi:hypothetical protein